MTDSASETTIIVVVISIVTLIASFIPLVRFVWLRRMAEKRQSQISISIEHADGSAQRIDLQPEDEGSITGFLDALKSDSPVTQDRTLKEDTKDGR